jgi:thioredoxin 1
MCEPVLVRNLKPQKGSFTSMAGNLHEFTDDSFQTEVLDSDQPVLVDFWAPWCGPCRMLMPTIEELSEEYAGKVKIGKVNTDECTQTAASYGITSIPTVMLFKGGEMVDKVVGAPPKQHFVDMISKATA